MAKLYATVDIKNLEPVKEAYAIANNALFFTRGYRHALYRICGLLKKHNNPETIGRRYIGENEIND